jgi:glyoxylase-like metal-dependent hydrolase (beta-lactamase superfamily II)
LLANHPPACWPFSPAGGSRVTTDKTPALAHFIVQWRRHCAISVVRFRQMVFEQFYLGCLSHASYLIGSDGVAAVVDPQRDIGIYLEAAAERGLRIEHIIETHLHADFV